VKASRRRLSNRSELTRVLSGLGFDEYIVEDLTHQEQIELFSGADVVVGAHGAGLTNVLFSKETKVVELFPYPWIPYPHYFYLCESLGHPYRWVWGETEEANSYPHPEHFRVDVNDVLNALHTVGAI
jgi:capsular polysaccharide biosynthesis protein